ncbi:hypothetical protein [Actinosynnema sp. NPDC020468]|uniref:hypothetical protein n=1 Tax=Actinosynnema sp. NPDC020468 TaxID=3154488 RepID=UPI0033D3429A
MTGSTRHATVRRLLIASAAAGGLLLAAVAPANAAGSYIGSNSGGANVRTCPSTTCGSLGYLGNNTGVTMQCWIDNQWVYPPSSDYASNRWFRSATPVGTGYLHSSLVENQTSVPHC